MNIDSARDGVWISEPSHAPTRRPRREIDALKALQSFRSASRSARWTRLLGRLGAPQRMLADLDDIAVRDQGRGIPAEQHQTIFKPYVQLDNPTRDRAKGIGLGLSIVQEAASLLGGEIRLISSPGRGSRFSLTLPEGCWQPIRETNRDSGRLRPPVGGNLKGRRLLLVEDDPMAAAALTAWAGTWGLVVMHYADPGGVTNDVAPDLILCDIRLPGTRDGIDWLSDWLVVWPKARGLLLSGELLRALRGPYRCCSMAPARSKLQSLI